MTKKDRIKMIEDNLDEGQQRYNEGKVSDEAWKRMKKDARNRIQELKNS
jgi:hypothetical protein